MRNILEYNSYDIISSLESGLSNIFPYVKVITNKIYASTLVSKSGRPIVRIDSKNPVKALLLEIKEDGVVIKSIVNSTTDKNLIQEIIEVFGILPNSYKIWIDRDVSGGFWDKIIQKYPEYNWIKL
jgi:hypothetical protein